MLLLSKQDIKNVFSMKDAIDANKKAFKLLVEGGANSPIRTQIQAPKNDGCFLFMPAYAEELDVASLKVVNVFPNNLKSGLPSTPAQVMLIDGNTGIISALLDGTYVTQLRTGAATGVAFDLLGKKDSKIGALIGTGGQAPCQLEAMLTARDLDEVRVFSRNYEKTVAFAKRMSEELAGYGTKIIPVKSSDEAINNADLIVTVTPSTKPVFDGKKVKKGATISCVGGYQPAMQELDQEVLPRTSKIYFDSKEAVLSEAGDILIPLEKGIITEEDFTGDIGDVITGKIIGREDKDEIIVFKTVGFATMDLVAAKAIYDKAINLGIGTNWE